MMPVRAGDEFESLAKANGQRYWSARDVMDWVGETSWPAFKKTMNRAISICATLGIPILDHFTPVSRKIGGRVVEDYKLSRQACFFTVLNGDPENVKVALLQTYLFSLSVLLGSPEFDHFESAERVAIRFCGLK